MHAHGHREFRRGVLGIQCLGRRHNYGTSDVWLDTGRIKVMVKDAPYSPALRILRDCMNLAISCRITKIGHLCCDHSRVWIQYRPIKYLNQYVHG